MIFNKKNKAPFSYRWTEKHTEKTIRYQRQLAGKLNQWAAGYSITKQRSAFVLFCVLFGGYCLYVLINAIF